MFNIYHYHFKQLYISLTFIKITVEILQGCLGYGLDDRIIDTKLGLIGVTIRFDALNQIFNAVF